MSFSSARRSLSAIRSAAQLEKLPETFSKTTTGTAPSDHEHSSGKVVAILSANAGQVSWGPRAVAAGQFRALVHPASTSRGTSWFGGAALEPRCRGGSE